MATSSQPKRYLLMGFNAIFERHHVEFVDNLPATVPVCSSCGAVPSEHYTLRCKHVFCAACFEDVVKTRPSSPRCPIDNKTTRILTATPRQTTSVEAVRRLLVFCWNRQRGCTYTVDLADMTVHFQKCPFYEVICPLCYKVMTRPKLADHFRAQHEGRIRMNEPAKNSSRTSTVPTVKVDETDGASILFPVCGGFVRADLEGDVRELVGEAASGAAEDIEQRNESLFLELLSGVELIKDRLVELADAARVSLPAGGAVEGAIPPSRSQRDDVPVRSYTWVVRPYSRLRVGVHFVDSPVFFIAPGYKVELKVCILAVAMMELSVSVKIHRDAASDVPRASQPPWPLQRTCQFTLFHNASDHGHVTSSFALGDAFNTPPTYSASSNSETLVSGWLGIGKMEKYLFESDYVNDDAFLIGFSTQSSL
ncbi:uncharacterized protein LOC144137611 [Haemaphysalis longicornis]